MKNKVDKWIITPMSLLAHFQIWNKVLTSIDVYSSSCWAPSFDGYKTLNKTLKCLLWSIFQGKKGFHKINWSTHCTLRDGTGMGILNTFFKPNPYAPNMFLQPWRTRKIINYWKTIAFVTRLHMVRHLVHGWIWPHHHP